MESKPEDKIPKERRKRLKDTEGKFDDDGFFRTPNGSFWDMDGEYFNRYGFDIHGGKYINGLDYIPGPTWIEELGCYPEDEEKYKKEDIDDFNDENEFNDINIGEEIEIKGLDNFNLGLDKLNINEEEKYKNNIKKDKKGKKKNKKDKKKKDSDDEWEEIEDE